MSGMVTIRPLAHADVPAAQRLREQAGWNQADADWQRLLAWDREGCWAAEQDGRVVGTTATISYGQRIAWVGMVLVDVEHRRRGIGRALLMHALAYLERRGVRTIALDATPDGRPLYASLGFVDAFGLERWRGDLTPRPPLRRGEGEQSDGLKLRWPVGSAPRTATSSRLPLSAPERDVDAVDVRAAQRPGGEVNSALRPLVAADLPAVVAYDARCFGVERGHILDALRAGHPGGCYLAERHGNVVGYALSRPGARAWHLGPIAADDPETAELLARAATSHAAARAFPELVFDVVRSNRHAVALARALGLVPVRRFIRMTRGGPPPAVDRDRLYSSAGPELG
jgi:ribosomal protein S18 acetylase RimI-like enzyme